MGFERRGIFSASTHRLESFRKFGNSEGHPLRSGSANCPCSTNSLGPASGPPLPGPVKLPPCIEVIRLIV